MTKDELTQSEILEAEPNQKKKIPKMKFTTINDLKYDSTYQDLFNDAY